jgi:chromosome segregation ATPase
LKPNDLLGSLASLEEYCQVLNSLGHEQLRILQAENQALNEQILSLNSSNRALTEKVDRINELHLRAEQQAVASEQLAAKLSEELNSEKHTFMNKENKFREDIKRLTNHVEDSSRCNQELKLQVSTTTAEISQMRSLLHRSEEIQEALQHRTAALEKLLLNKAEALTQSEQARKDQQQQSEELDHQFMACNAQLDQLRRDHAWVSGEKVALQQRTAELEKLLLDKAEALTQSDQARKDQQQQSEELDHQFMACNAQLDQLRRDHAWVSGEKVALQQRTAELEKLLLDKAEALTQSDQTCKEKQDLIEDLMEFRRQLEERLEDRITACEEAKTRLEQLTHYSSDLEKTLVVIRQKASSLEMQNSELKNGLEISFLSDRDKGRDVDLLRDQVAKQQTQITASEQAHAASKSRIAELQNQINRKRKELEEASLHKKNQSHQFSSIKKRNRLLQLQVHELQNQLEQTFALMQDQRARPSEFAVNSGQDHSNIDRSSWKSSSDVINCHRSLLLTAF